MSYRHRKKSFESERCNQPLMLRCFAGVELLTHHIATVPSVRSTGGRESKALQVEPLGFDFCFRGDRWHSFVG